MRYVYALILETYLFELKLFIHWFSKKKKRQDSSKGESMVPSFLETDFQELLGYNFF